MTQLEDRRISEEEAGSRMRQLRSELRLSRTEEAKRAAERRPQAPPKPEPSRVHMRGESTWCTAYIGRAVEPAAIAEQLAAAEEVAIVEHRTRGRSRTLSMITRKPGEGWRDLYGAPITVTHVG